MGFVGPGPDDLHEPCHRSGAGSASLPRGGVNSAPDLFPLWLSVSHAIVLREKLSGKVTPTHDMFAAAQA